MRLSSPIDVPIEDVDRGLMQQANARLDQLTKPLGSLGRLETLATQIVGITRNMAPRLTHKVIITMAADHGVVEEGVSAYPQAVTEQMVYNFLRGGAGINVLARHVGARVVVVDMGVAAKLVPHPDLVSNKIGYGTKNLAQGPAMTLGEAAAWAARVARCRSMSATTICSNTSRRAAIDANAAPTPPEPTTTTRIGPA